MQLSEAREKSHRRKQEKKAAEPFLILQAVYSWNSETAENKQKKIADSV